MKLYNRSLSNFDGDFLFNGLDCVDFVTQFNILRF